MAKPASVTVCEDSHVSPVVEGTLSETLLWTLHLGSLVQGIHWEGFWSDLPITCLKLQDCRYLLTLDITKMAITLQVHVFMPEI